MSAFAEENVTAGPVPVRIIHPLEEDGKKPVLFYHGWSSASLLQRTRAVILAAEGYTVYLPEAAHHGSRGSLDYYAQSSYDVFWQVIFQNIREFPYLLELVKRRGGIRPFVMGHSMGGITVMGLAASFGKEIAGAVSLNGSGDWLLTHLFLQARFGIALPRDWPLYDALAAASPLHHAEDMKTVPLLLLNGEADTSVDPRGQAHFYEVLTGCGGHPKRITYPGLGHFVTTNMMDDALAWMKELGARRS